MADRVLLAVDGNSLLHRAFHAQHSIAARSAAGEAIWAVRGLLTQLVAAIERVQADTVLVGFDDPAASTRRSRWPHYKASRVDKPESLVGQLQAAADVLTELGIAVVTPAGLEADDVLCSAAAFAAARGARTVIMTSDRDSFALIDDSTRVLRIINGGVESSPVLTAERLHLMIGIRPDQYRDFAALRGDPSDNLPGVPGIGPKTATRLLAAFGSAEQIFQELAHDGAVVAAVVGAKLANRLAEPQSQHRWQQNCQIMTMRSDVALDLDLGHGAGVLPIEGKAVRTVFRRHHLTACLPQALRVLAHHEGPTVDVRFAERHSAPLAERAPWGSKVRHPPLARRLQPKTDQLALF